MGKRKKISRKGNTRWLTDNLDRVNQKIEELSKVMGRQATMAEVATALTLEVGGKYDFSAKNIHDAKYNIKRVKPTTQVPPQSTNSNKPQPVNDLNSLIQHISILSEKMDDMCRVLSDIAKNTADINAASALFIEHHATSTDKKYPLFENIK